MGLLYVSVTIGILVGCIGATAYPRVRSSLRLLVFYAFTSSLMDIIGALTSSPGSSNHIYFNIYFVLEFFLMSFALKDLLGRSFKWILLTESVIFLSVYGGNLWYNGPNYLLMIAMVTAWAFLAVNCLIALYRTMVHPDPATALGVYIIAGLNLLYYCSVIPLFGMHRFLNEISKSMTGVLHNVSMGIDMARFVGIAVGLLYLARQNPNPQLHTAPTGSKLER